MKRFFSVLTHVNENGKATMVNIVNKNNTIRTAKATAELILPNNVYKAILENNIKKGDVLSVSRVAGIMGTKKCSELIPLCHPINIKNVNIDFKMEKKSNYGKMIITSEVNVNDSTGVEMEALTAVSVSALTVYDMCKAISKDIIIGKIMLQEKTGGKSGIYVRQK